MYCYWYGLLEIFLLLKFTVTKHCNYKKACYTSFASKFWLSVHTIQETGMKKTLNRLGCNRNASYFSFNLGGECPIKKPNTYQHQFEMYIITTTLDVQRWWERRNSKMQERQSYEGGMECPKPRNEFSMSCCGTFCYPPPPTIAVRRYSNSGRLSVTLSCLRDNLSKVYIFEYFFSCGL
jgi:hypothetical protein